MKKGNESESIFWVYWGFAERIDILTCEVLGSTSTTGKYAYLKNCCYPGEGAALRRCRSGR
jgi:hypothetical protein